jgi:hypothetical protein
MYQLLNERRFNPLESGQVRKVTSLLVQALSRIPLAKVPRHRSRTQTHGTPSLPIFGAYRAHLGDQHHEGTR